MQGGLHRRAFLLDALDEFLPALFLEFTNRRAHKDGALGVGGREQASGALQDRAQTLARTNTVYAGILDFSLSR